MSDTSLILTPTHALPIEARVTEPDDVGGSAYTGAVDYFVLEHGYEYRGTTAYISPANAMAYSAVWACVRWIAQSVAGLGWHVFQKTRDSKQRIPIEDNIAWTLDVQASPEINAFDFRQVMLKDALLTGNAYAEIERKQNGEPLWLHRIDPMRVSPDRDSNDRLYYTVKGPLGTDPVYLDPSQIFHIKG